MNVLSVLATVAVACAVPISMILLRVLLVLVRRAPPAPAVRRHPLRICVVLGSGGHTSEMLQNLRLLGRRWLEHRAFYVASDTDKDSAAAAAAFESSVRRFATLHTIPRARSVGQSYVTSVFSTLRAFRRCLTLMVQEPADVILVNGPGVCIPVVFAAIVAAALWQRPRPAIAYFESFTCVDHLSLSGRIMRHVADALTVQWAGLEAAVPRSTLVGPFVASTVGAADGERVVPKHKPSERQALVTVGSTQFDALIAAVDERLFAALRDVGVARLLVQVGRTAMRVDQATLCAQALAYGVHVDIFDYRPHLAEAIRLSDIVVSHAGAGTILEAFAHRTALVVVPNTRLMNDHQSRFATALADMNFLLHSPPDGIAAAVRQSMEVPLRAFPAPDSARLIEVFDGLVHAPRREQRT